MTVFDADVIVMGAGPAGLMLAAEVASAGLSCTVLDRRLVRPDGYIAWAGPEAHLLPALASWCGEPVTSQPAPASAAPGSD